jgi:hypothetical protein
MPRITHVAKAQQRFATVPVLDSEGQPKRTPVMRDGVQKTTKHGKPVFMAVTVADKSQPLEPYTCDHCRQPILVGTPYKHMTPKSGPYGGTKRTRHEACPDWQVWEYSSSLSARLAQIQFDAAAVIADIEDEDSATSAASEIAESIREVASEKEEAASNIEDGFQHETEQSQELNDIAEQLNSWADEIEGTTFDDFPEPEEEDCEVCGGTGEQPKDDDTEVIDEASEEPTEESDDVEVDDEPEVCSECEGACVITPDEPDEDEVSDWVENAKSALQDAVDNCPV